MKISASAVAPVLKNVPEKQMMHTMPGWLPEKRFM